MAEGGDSVDSDRKSASSSRNTIPDMSSLYLGSEEVEPLLCREHGQEFKHFCTDHMTELCITCKRMEHKNCETIIGIGEAAENIYSEIHGEKISQSVIDLNARFQDIKTVVDDLKSKISNKRKTAVGQIKQARKELDDYLNILEAKAINEVDRKLKENKDNLEEKYDVCTASLASLSTSSSDFERTMSVGNKAEKFIAVNRATTQTKQYCNLLLDMNREMSEMIVNFEPNAFTEILSFGTVTGETLNVTDVFAEKTPIYTGDMKLKSDKSFVTSFDLLPAGRKIVLDTNNNKIQVYDKRNAFITETVLPVEGDDKCLSLVLNSNTEALVSTNYGKVFKVKIGDKLHVNEMKCRYRIFTMTKYNEDFLCVLLDSEKVQLCIIDKDMSKLKQTILNDDGTLFPNPAFLGVSADKNTAYVLDLPKGCYGITLDGQVVFHYQNPEAECHGGLAVDSDELFIGVAVGNKGQVETLNPSGERQEVYTVFGDAYPLKLEQNQLVLFNCEKRNIEFYCLLK